MALQRAVGSLSTNAITRMQHDMSWFRDLSAEERSWVGLIVQAGIKNFIDWYLHESGAPEGSAIATTVFGAAPRALTRVITLQQTVDLIRLSLDVTEHSIDEFVDPLDAPDVHRAVSWYGREVAFATAEVYARAAESRGAWDARLEALVVDAVLRSETDESVVSRASALGWSSPGDVAVVLGATPIQRAASDVFEEVRRACRTQGMDALCAIQGERLVVVVGSVADPLHAAQAVADHFPRRREMARTNAA